MSNYNGNCRNTLPADRESDIELRSQHTSVYVMLFFKFSSWSGSKQFIAQYTISLESLQQTVHMEQLNYNLHWIANS